MPQPPTKKRRPLDDEPESTANGVGGGAGEGVIEDFEAQVRGMAVKAVSEVVVVDVHTHLFPEAHGDLLLWGIDHLLTYHYLIAELFMVWHGLKPAQFYKLSVREQADVVWVELFVSEQ